VMTDYLESVILGFLRRVALPAGLARSTHAVHCGSDRPVVRVRRKAHQLSDARKLVLNKRRSARADVTVHARNSSMSGLLVSGIWGLHDRVARLATKFPEIHVIDAAIRGQCKNAHIRECQKTKRPGEPCRSRSIYRNVLLQHTPKAAKPARCNEDSKRH